MCICVLTSRSSGSELVSRRCRLERAIGWVVGGSRNILSSFRVLTTQGTSPTKAWASFSVMALENPCPWGWRWRHQHSNTHLLLDYRDAVVLQSLSHLDEYLSNSMSKHKTYPTSFLFTEHFKHTLHNFFYTVNFKYPSTH